MRVFLKVFGALGYSSSRQVAARRALALYEELCADRAEEDREFWARGASSPFPKGEQHDLTYSERQIVIFPQRSSHGSW
jgi:hypothetical protein